MYKEVLNDLENKKKNHWQSLFNMIGANAGQEQNIITEVLHNYHKQEAQMERVMTRFSRGERVEPGDLKLDPSEDPSSRMNCISALRDVGKQQSGVTAKRTRFSNLRNTAVSLHRSSNSKPVEPLTAGSRRSQQTLKSVNDMPRIFVNEKEFGRYGREQPENNKISNARELMDYIILVNTTRSNQVKQAKERRQMVSS